jgi:prephenate dehydratase
MAEALQGLRRVCSEVRFFGSYPRATSSASLAPEETRSAPTGTSDADFADAAAWLAQIRAGTLP